MSTPLGTADVRTVQASTGQILTDGLFDPLTGLIYQADIQATSPALFTADSSGTGQVAAINAANGTINSATNPVKAGDFISLFGTGQGFIAGAPPDGTPPTAATPTAETPQVWFTGLTNYLDPSDVEYSGLAPDYVGLWQINARVPATTPPSSANGPVYVYVGIGGYYSAQNGVQTYIYVK
jgi:uncharacterized protein (TIGR03437 family)